MKISKKQIQQIVKENMLDWFSMPKMIPDEERYEMLLDKAHEHGLDRNIARAEPLASAGDFEAAIQELMQGITAVNESTHRSQKLSKVQLKNIIKEEKAKLLEAYEYIPVDEMYTMLDHLGKAQMIAEEIVKHSERDPAYEEFGDPFFSFSNQLKKLMAPVGSQADKAYKMGNTAQPAYRDDLDPGDII